MNILISLSLSVVNALIRDKLSNSHSESNYVLRDLYENSLETAHSYLRMAGNQEEHKQLVQLALQHLETAYSTKYMKNTPKENDLILCIIRLHYDLQNPYSIIQMWAERLSSASKINEEIKNYLTPEDYGELIARLNGFDVDDEDDLEELESKYWDEKIQDELDYAASGWGGFP